jgi:hypothetical protein
MSVCPEELKLVALDRDDIEVVSAHVQDSLVRVGDMLWLPREHRFVMALNRFDWMTVVDAKHAAEYRRCRTALRFERVLGCKCRGLDQSDKEARLNLLAVEFAENDSPAAALSGSTSNAWRPNSPISAKSPRRPSAPITLPADR